MGTGCRRADRPAARDDRASGDRDPVAVAVADPFPDAGPVHPRDQLSEADAYTDTGPDRAPDTGPDQDPASVGDADAERVGVGVHRRAVTVGPSDGIADADAGAVLTEPRFGGPRVVRFGRDDRFGGVDLAPLPELAPPLPHRPPLLRHASHFCPTP